MPPWHGNCLDRLPPRVRKSMKIGRFLKTIWSPPYSYLSNSRLSVLYHDLLWSWTKIAWPEEWTTRQRKWDTGKRTRGTDNKDGIRKNEARITIMGHGITFFLANKFFRPKTICTLFDRSYLRISATFCKQWIFNKLSETMLNSLFTLVLWTPLERA